MKYYLKTKQECDEIVKNCDAFYRSDRFVEGCNVVTYDYRLASMSDFVDNEAFELRGLTFVEQLDGTWKRNILMQKFFNLNQTKGEDLVGIYGPDNRECIGEPKIICRKNSDLYHQAMSKMIKQYEKVIEPGESWMLEDIKDEKIRSVQNKEDGSIISFVKFPNGKIRAKSKTSFISDQAELAQEVFDNDSLLQEFIEDMIDKDYTPIFEIVSPDNQIVLEYSETALILLQVRDNEGFYNPPEDLESYTGKYGIQRATQFSHKFHDFDFLLEQKEINKEPIEGWVITLETGKQIKIKTNKYLSLHDLMGPGVFRENLLIQTIINGDIDDVIAALVPGDKKDRIISMDKQVTDKYNRLVREFVTLRGEYFNKYQENRKEFALKHSKDICFKGVMRTLNTSFRDVEQTAEKTVKEIILKDTNSLKKAKVWLSNIK